VFRPNDDHKQMSLFTSVSEMHPSVVRRLHDSWAPVFYEHVFCQIDEEPFSVLYSEDTGRPNFPINILVGLEILAAMHSYTVEQTLEQFNFNVQVRWALGVRGLWEYSLSERTIYEFRERLYQYALLNPGRECLIHQQFREISDHLMAYIGLTREEMRMDSTQIMSNIRRAGRLALSFDVLKQAIKACPVELLTPELLEVLEPSFKKNLLYKVKSREVPSRLREMLGLCATLLTIVAQHEELQGKREIELLARFFIEQAEYDEQVGVWKAREHEKGTTSGHLRSAYDEDATCRVKGNEVYVGYVANITETCADENPVQLITDYILEKNIVADTTMAKEALPHLAEQHGLKDLYVDGGYSGESVYETAANQDVSMHYTNMTGRETKKIPINEFIFDGDKVTHCPAGHPSDFSIYDKERDTILVHFNLETCKACPDRNRCPTSPNKEAHRLTITKKNRVAAETRDQLNDQEKHKENTSKRAAIEGTISCVKHDQGAGKLRVRGLNRSSVMFGFIAIGRNVKQLLRWRRGEKRRSLQDAERRRRKGFLPIPAAG
jgi:hypothetical protein